MALKRVDNYHFWDDTLPGQPGTFTSTNGCTVAGNILNIPFNGGFAAYSNRLTQQSTYILNLRMAFENPVTYSSSGILHSTTDFADQCGLALINTGKWQFFRGNFFAPQAFIGPTSLIAAVMDGVTQYDVETKITIGNPGSIELRINGAVEIGPVVANTQSVASATADSVTIGANTSGFSGAPMHSIHDIIMDSTPGGLCDDFIGPVDVILLPPTGDGFYTDWSVTGAANRWQAVLTADGDTSYISDNVVGDKNTFTQPGLPAGSTAVIATGVWVNARRDDAVARSFKVLMRETVGPTDALGSINFFVGANYEYFFQPFEVSPFTGLQWTVSEVGVTQFGVQLT